MNCMVYQSSGIFCWVQNAFSFPGDTVERGRLLSYSLPGSGKYFENVFTTGKRYESTSARFRFNFTWTQPVTLVLCCASTNSTSTGSANGGFYPSNDTFYVSTFSAEIV